MLAMSRNLNSRLDDSSIHFPGSSNFRGNHLKFRIIIQQILHLRYIHPMDNFEDLQSSQSTGTWRKLKKISGQTFGSDGISESDKSSSYDSSNSSNRMAAMRVLKTVPLKPLPIIPMQNSQQFQDCELVNNSLETPKSGISISPREMEDNSAKPQPRRTKKMTHCDLSEEFRIWRSLKEQAENGIFQLENLVGFLVEIIEIRKNAGLAMVEAAKTQSQKRQSMYSANLKSFSNICQVIESRVAENGKKWQSFFECVNLRIEQPAREYIEKSKERIHRLNNKFEEMRNSWQNLKNELARKQLDAVTTWVKFQDSWKLKLEEHSRSKKYSETEDLDSLNSLTPSSFGNTPISRQVSISKNRGIKSIMKIGTPSAEVLRRKSSTLRSLRKSFSARDIGPLIQAADAPSSPVQNSVLSEVLLQLNMPLLTGDRNAKSSQKNTTNLCETLRKKVLEEFSAYERMLVELNDFQFKMYIEYLPEYFIELVDVENSRFEILSNILSTWIELTQLYCEESITEPELNFLKIIETAVSEWNLFIVENVHFSLRNSSDSSGARNIDYRVKRPVKIHYLLPCQPSELKMFTPKLAEILERDVLKVLSDLEDAHSRVLKDLIQEQLESQIVMVGRAVRSQEKDDAFGILGVKEGDLIRITHTNSIGSNKPVDGMRWWSGYVITRRPRGKEGVFPSNLIEIVPVNRKLTLSHCFEIPYCLRLFRMFLISEHSEEELDFLLEVESFLKEIESADLLLNRKLMRRRTTGLVDFPTSARDKACSIVQKYVLPELAVRSVNLSSDVSGALIGRYMSGNFGNDMFDYAAKEIFQLLSSDSFQRFKKSALFTEKFLALMENIQTQRVGLELSKLPPEEARKAIELELANTVSREDLAPLVSSLSLTQVIHESQLLAQRSVFLSIHK